jgi:hypothetical protein
MEWEAMLAAEGDEPGRALTLLEASWRVRRAGSGRAASGRRRCSTSAASRGRSPRSTTRWPPPGSGTRTSGRACTTIAGSARPVLRPDEADREFGRAAQLWARRLLHAGCRRRARSSTRSVRAGPLDHIPSQFRKYHPADRRDGRRLSPRRTSEDPFVLGVYHGVPRSSPGVEPGPTPTRSSIFKRSHEVVCPDPREARGRGRADRRPRDRPHFGIEHERDGRFPLSLDPR